MNIILLSGGSGKRLWPLSNDIRSKQFVKMFKNDDGEYESMVQRVYRQIKSVSPDSKITIATSKSQVSTIVNQLGDKVSVCVEPQRRDTFPAIALAVAYLNTKENVSENDTVLVCPVDPYVDDSYFTALKELYDYAQTGKYNLNLMGVEPTYPSEKYGYIIPSSKDKLSSVSEFKEKPTEEIAREYIKDGALWNCGVFAFKLGYLLDIAHGMVDFKDYYDIYSNYELLEKISFDYAVVEKEKSIGCIRYKGEWKDIGSWNTFAEEMCESSIGNVTMDDTCENTNVINELNIPLLCMGLKNMVVVASSDGILISDKEQSSYIKPYVDKLGNEVKYAEKSWGSYTVLDVTPDSMVIKVTLLPGHRMHYHSHEHRDEIWNIVSGTAVTIVDGMEQSVGAGDVITMSTGCKHTIIAKTALEIIEVQMGEKISVKDKIKYELK